MKDLHEAILERAAARGWTVIKLTMFKLAEIRDGSRRALVHRGITDHSGAASSMLTHNRMTAVCLLSRLGLQTAPTLLTNRPHALAPFLAEHGRITVRPAKHLSGRGIVRGVTTPEELDAAFEEAARAFRDTAPAIVAQKELDGGAVRVTVVGERVFGRHLSPNPAEDTFRPYTPTPAQVSLARTASGRMGVTPLAVDMVGTTLLSANAYPALHHHGDEAVDTLLDMLFDRPRTKASFDVRQGSARPWSGKDPATALYARPLVEGTRRRGGQAWQIPGASDDWALLATPRRVQPVRSTLSDATGAATMALCRSKAATREVLYARGYPVPPSFSCSRPEHAAPLLRQFKKLVVKPLDGSHGNGITVGIEHPKQLVPAFETALAANRLPLPIVVVQPHLPGNDTRVTVIDGTVFATMRLPAAVRGDGTSTVSALVEAHNAGLALENRSIALGPAANRVLRAQRLTVDSVPEAGRRVVLGEVSNARKGGICLDVTDLICPEARAIACAIARDLRVGVLGVDFFSRDIRKEAGLILELNTAPALNLHEVPTVGQSRDAAAPLLEVLFGA